MQRKSKKIEQGDATREALLVAARELFGMQGYAETSLDVIVRRAGVTKGALYHHFAGKEALFRGVFEAVTKDLSHQAFPLPVGHGETEVWSDLLARCQRFIQLRTDPCVQRILLRDARAVLPWDVWYQVEHEYGVVMLRASLRRAMHRQIIQPLPLNALAMILTGALNEACTVVANASDRSRALDDTLVVIEQVLNGLRVATPADPPEEL